MTSVIGAPVVRKEDPNLLTGRGTYVDNLKLSGMLHMAYVRSPHAHAAIREVDTSAALALPGVHGAFAAGDLPGLPPVLSVPGLERPSLAGDRVRFVGEPVAVVVARDRYAAMDAARAVRVEYEPAPAVGSIAEALAEGAPLLFPQVGSNVVHSVPAAADIEPALSAAPRREKLTLVNQRLAAVPMEPMGCVADWGPSGLTLWAACQAPYWVRNRLHDLLGLPHQAIRVVAPDVGGGFGAKQSWYPEYVLTALLSKRLGRPVKYMETRSENLVHMTQGRGQVQEIEVGFDDEGHILALRNDITQELGGYPYPDCLGLPFLTMVMSQGCYRIPAVTAGYRCVVTNTTPLSSYRGAGRPEASFMIERVVDLVADRTGVDPLEVRRRNFIQADEFPFAIWMPGFAYDSGNFPGLLDELLRHVDYEGLRREQAARRDDPDRPLMGIGFSTFIELGGVGPSAAMEGFGHLGGWESANVRVNPDASATVTIGTSPHGQGHETAFAQIAADELGIPFDSISVLHGDTAQGQEGIGTFGSRSIPIGGEAVKQAAGRAREKALQVAAHVLEAHPGDIELVDGRFRVRGTDRTLEWGEVANKGYRPTQLGDLEAGIEGLAFAEPPNFTFPSGAHCCVVGVDRRTGKVAIERYVAVDDCGTVINPLMAEGQIMGGVAQGIAQALYEEVRYGDDAQPLTTTLADYLAPSAAEIPAFELAHTVTPTPSNSLGAKGLGESGATGAPQAVVNAVVDALSHLGVTNLDMPLTPEKVWSAMQARS